MTNQTDIAREILRYIEQKYPHIDAPDFLKRHFSRVVLGEIPDYSGRHEKGYQITSVTTVTASSFAVCYAYDAFVKDLVFVTTKKRLDDKSCDTQVSLLGGFTNLDKAPDKNTGEGEQPYECIIREISEETMDVEGHSVLKIEPERLQLIYSGIDYRGWEQGLQGTHNTGFLVQLRPEELYRIKQHAERTQSDRSYSMSVSTITNNEVAEILLIPARHLAHMSAKDFRNPSEFAILRNLFAVPGAITTHDFVCR